MHVAGLKGRNSSHSAKQKWKKKKLLGKVTETDSTIDNQLHLLS